MTLLGLSPLVFFAGLGTMTLVLLGLHLLRVRLRRASVDSLLFFAQVADVQRPRTLLGAPRRWLAFLLALLAITLLWLRYAEPGFAAAGPSRLVLVDRHGQGPGAAGPGLRELRDFVESYGLGPRGAVLGIGAHEDLLLSPGEAPSLLEARLAEAVAPGRPADLWALLDAASDRLGAGDEIVWFGPELGLPPRWHGLPLRHVAAGPAPRCGLLALRPGDADRWIATVWAASGRGELLARSGAGVVQRLPFEQQAAPSVELVLAAQPEELRVRDAESGAEHRVPLEIPDASPVPIELPAALSTEDAALFDALIASDPGLRVAAAGDARVAVRRPGAADRAQSARAELRIVPGRGAGPRQSRVTELCPLPIALRSAWSEDASALGAAPNGGGETWRTETWIRDDVTGEPLVRLVRPPAGAPYVELCAWLLAFEDDRDLVPLLAGTLRLLGGERLPRSVPAGEPFAVAQLGAPALTFEGPGAVTRRFAATTAPVTVRLGPGLWRLGAESVFVHDVQRPAATVATPDTASFESLGERSPLPWLLLLAALLLLLTDVVLYQRGRLP